MLFIKQLLQPPYAKVNKVPPLADGQYAQRFLPLLALEFSATMEILASATMHGVPLKPWAGKAEEGMAFYELEARSIKEGFPPCALGDKVLLKQIRWSSGTCQGIAFEAQVWHIRRAAGIVVLRCDALQRLQDSMSFVVQWLPQSSVFEAAHAAVAFFHRALLAQPISLPTKAAPWRAPIATLSSVEPPFHLNVGSAQSWLFPGAEHVRQESEPVNGHAQLDFVDRLLNQEQQEAVQAIVYHKRKVPFLINGVAGSGKTKTVVESVLQILKCDLDAHLLVCGASHPSADTLARRLAASLSTAEMLRFVDVSRPPEEVSLAVHAYCRFDELNTQFVIPPLHEILSFRVIVCAAIDARLLSKYRADNYSLQILGRHLSSLFPRKHAPLEQPHWTHLLIDEAGQLTEPDTLIPLAAILPLSGSDMVPQVVLCGDVMQLGPQIFSDDARALDYDCSLLGRLLERTVYADHPAARKNFRRAASGSHADEWTDQPFVNLVRNYRSATGILAPLASMFYEDTLAACAPSEAARSPLLAWPGLVRPNFPFNFHGIETAEEWVDEGESFYNSNEIKKVVELVVGVLEFAQKNNISLLPSQITVISPFREQVWRIRIELRKIPGLFQVDVGNVESVQGAENRIVILSTVRSSKRFLEADAKRGRGLYLEVRRLCVALTRAKELLLVVGNATLLSGDYWWATLLRYAHRQQCYAGPRLPAAITNDQELQLTLLEAGFGTEYLSESIATSSSLQTDVGLSLATRMAQQAML